MKITWFGHAAYRIETGSSVILVDPYLKGNPAFERSGLDWDEAVKGVTHVALSHGHDDHLGDSAEIIKASGATLFAIIELANYLAERGAEKVELMNTGGTVATADFEVTLTNAAHSSSSGGVYLGAACGLIIKAKDGLSVYHMGDTDIFADMALIEEFHKPDVGIVPIGDRFTMGARSAALACKKYFSFKTILPCHYGSFPIIDQSPEKFLALMSGHNVVVQDVGGSITL